VKIRGKFIFNAPEHDPEIDELKMCMLGKKNVGQISG
jgi:hypothetical protein